MRILDFGGANGPVLFDTIYGGILSGPMGYDLQKARVIKSIIRKLEQIASPIMSAGPKARVRFELNTNIGTIVALEEAEYKLLLESLEAVEWTALGATAAVEAYDWLHEIKEG